MGYACDICGMPYARKEDMNLHMNQAHMMDDLEASDEDTRSESESSENKSEDEHMSESEKSESESEPDSDEEDEEIWDRVLRNIWNETNDNQRHDLMKNGKYSAGKILKAVNEHVDEANDYSTDISGTKVYQAITEEEERLQEKDYEPEEVKRLAWKNRKYLVKAKVINPFLKKFNYCSSSESETENENDAKTE